MPAPPPSSFSRRDLLKGGAAILATAALERWASEALAQATAPASAPAPSGSAQPGPAQPGPARLGLITDLHYADKEPARDRFYRETPAKLAEAGEVFRREGVAAVVCLGDLIDSAPELAAERGHLTTINKQLVALAPRRHYVLGNHCVDALTKAEFLEAVGQPKSYGSFDLGGVHFVTLDACFRVDGTPYGRSNAVWTDTAVPAEQLAWLRKDLAGTSFKTVVFIHQRTDIDDEKHSVRNATAVREALEQSGKVAGVFQGHHHVNDLREVNGIHYCTLEAMVDGSGPGSNAYSILEVSAAGAVRLKGFRNQESRAWAARG